MSGIDIIIGLLITTWVVLIVQGDPTALDGVRKVGIVVSATACGLALLGGLALVLFVYWAGLPELVLFWSGALVIWIVLAVLYVLGDPPEQRRQIDESVGLDPSTYKSKQQPGEPLKAFHDHSPG